MWAGPEVIWCSTLRSPAVASAPKALIPIFISMSVWLPFTNALVSTTSINVQQLCRILGAISVIWQQWLENKLEGRTPWSKPKEGNGIGMQHWWTLPRDGAESSGNQNSARSVVAPWAKVSGWSPCFIGVSTWIRLLRKGGSGYELSCLLFSSGQIAAGSGSPGKKQYEALPVSLFLLYCFLWTQIMLPVTRWREAGPSRRPEWLLLFFILRLVCTFYSGLNTRQRVRRTLFLFLWELYIFFIVAKATSFTSQNAGIVNSKKTCEQFFHKCASPFFGDVHCGAQWNFRCVLPSAVLTPYGSTVCFEVNDLAPLVRFKCGQASI